MASAKPLTKQQRQAAELLGRGMEQQLVAAKVGVGPRAVRRWLTRDDFAAIVAQGHAERQAAAPASARAALEDALGATKDDGSPDHAIRTKAAMALLKLDSSTANATEAPTGRETIIVKEHLDD